MTFLVYFSLVTNIIRIFKIVSVKYPNMTLFACQIDKSKPECKKC